ncbi:MAG: A24 family peptidase [Candidatus Riflebacteria bacterium]|nr:A24 family peptidase [Candidatus Riflebacteria bacterium]
MQLDLVTHGPMILATTVAFIALVTDLRYGRIYNWLTFPAMLTGWLLNLYLHGLPGLGYSLVATLFGILIYMPGAVFGLVGMGDVKLFGALGAICGSNYVLNIFLYSSALGIPHAVLVQTLNYGRNAFGMAFTSFSSGAFLHKTIYKENADQLKTGRYRFLMGVDIFIACIIGWFYLLNITF